MKKIKKYLVFTIVSLLLNSFVLNAQNVLVSDTIFADFLCTNFPNSMNLTCDSLIVQKAKSSADGTMDFSNLGITSFDEFTYFLSTDTLKGNNNDITWIPTIPLAVEYLDLSNNSISGFNTLFLNGRSNLDPLVIEGRADLSYLDLSFNLLTELPRLDTVEWLLKTVNVQNNNLASVYDLSPYEALTSLNIANNFLTFEDLLPIVNLETYSSNLFVLAPQKQQKHDITYIDAIEGDDIVYTLSVDAAIESNSYEWYKDNEVFATTNVNHLTFENVQLSDMGNYTVKITNSTPELAGVEITYSNTFEIKVIPSIHILTNDVQTDCESHVVKLNDFELSSLTEGAEYLLIDSMTNVSHTLEGNTFTLTTDGDFDLIQLNNGSVIQHQDNWIILPRLPTCVPIISPNGDHIDDTFYFEEEGKIKVFGKSGFLVKELNGPVIWDVTDKTGTLLEPGLYLVLLPDGSYKSLSILY